MDVYTYLWKILRECFFLWGWVRVAWIKKQILECWDLTENKYQEAYVPQPYKVSWHWELSLRVLLFLKCCFIQTYDKILRHSLWFQTRANLRRADQTFSGWMHCTGGLWIYTEQGVPGYLIIFKANPSHWEPQIIQVWRFTRGRARTTGRSLSFVWTLRFYNSIQAKLDKKMLIIIYSRAFLQSYVIIIEI